MNTRDRLNSYIKQLEARLRLGALLRGGAILTSVALAATVLLVFIANQFAFSSISMTGARIVLLLAMACAVGFGLAVPLYGLDRRRAAVKAEKVYPQFEQRLVTFAERDGSREPFLELLAADTLDRAASAPAAGLFPDRKLAGSLLLGLASLGVLVWMIFAGPGYMGQGAALLWTGSSHSATPLYDLRVTPGDAAVRRNAEETITAQVTGLLPSSVRLFARSQSASKWEQLAMQPQQGGSGYQYVFGGLPEGIEYYVEAGPLRSRHFTLKVVDLPTVKQIRVTYRYPSWTGQPNSVDEHGGDLRAVEGTDADLQITTDRPMKDGILVLDDGQQLKLSPGSTNEYSGTVHIAKDGSYHVSATDSGQQVRLSDDYFIEARKADPPEIHITRPGSDYRSSPIEEVTVAVKASDEFGLTGMDLHYSVNGGPEKTVSLLKQKGAKDADGSTTLSLEDFKLVPGDLVSLYATAKDAHLDSRTDMIFVQADPFEREFSQSQESAGGGGGGAGGGQGNPEQISQREKEIIAQTWKDQGDKTSTKDALAENAKFLSDVQSKLRDQAVSLAGRLDARELDEQNQEFSDFQKDMNGAAQAMDPAVQKLQQQKWNDAIPNEEKALQYLLRAEATFRQIEVAFGNRGGGGGGGAGRDLASLFDLELDTEKNQFETGQTAASAQQRAQDIDDALQKLDDLAKRQQDLAEQPRNATQAEQQRWQQEMLRREAAELQQQMQQLAQQQNQSGQQGQQGQSGDSGQSSQGSQSSAQGGSPNSSSSASGSQNGSGDSRMQQAMNALRQAQQAMERAASDPNNQDAARNAANQLRGAADQLNALQQQQSTQQLDSLAQQAGRMAGQERDQADQMRKLFGQGNPEANAQQLQRLADDRQSLADQVAQLEKQMQQAQRSLSSSNQQSAASSKLRDALGGMEEADLQNRLKKSAEWLSQGIDPNSDGGESDISAAMQKLKDELSQAQQAYNKGSGNNPQDALNRVEQLRNQLDTIIRSTEKNPNPPKILSGEDSRGPGQAGSNGQQGQNAQGGGAAGQGQGGVVMGLGGQQGDIGAGFAGGARDLRGDLRGFDIGNNTPQGGSEVKPVPLTQADVERALQEAQREAEALKQTVQGQPQPLADINDLLEQLKHLDPSRFPGNPAMVQQLHDEVLGTVDRLELQVRRDLDDQQGGQIRSGDSTKVPAGYQESVAEYFRRLSQTQTQSAPDNH